MKEISSWELVPQVGNQKAFPGAYQRLFLAIPERGRTGFTFCVDEASSTQNIEKSQYEQIMKVLLQASQNWLYNGGFWVVVAALLSIYDFRETIVEDSG